MELNIAPMENRIENGGKNALRMFGFDCKCYQKKTENNETQFSRNILRTRGIF